MAASLSSLAFISQKIIHQKSGHTFLLYGNVATDEQSCTLLATLASPAGAISFDTAALDRWWCATWTKTEFEDFAVRAHHLSCVLLLDVFNPLNRHLKLWR